jgi:TonB family protein
MKTSAAILALALATAIPARAADRSLAAARELYASAAYEDALTMLKALAASDTLPAPDALQVDEYQSLCLYALGRTSEAESIAQAAFKKDPFYEPSPDDLSPRVATMFESVRRSVLPDIIRAKYQAAKAAVDREDWPVAEGLLTDTRRLLAKAQEDGVKDSITDLRIVVDGFLDLAHASAKEASNRASAAADTSTAPSSAARAPAAAPRIYDASSAEVTAPVVVRQDVPAVPQALVKTVRKRGRLDVTIEPDGHVSDVVIRESINSAYDAMLTSAAHYWRYKPATKAGAPVRFVKTILFNVSEE